MYRPSFNGCWAKVNRAKEHRDALDRYIGEFFSIKSNCPILSAKYDSDRRKNVIYISKIPDLSPFLTRIALYVGDIVHNLRCTLDHLVYELALYNKGGSLAPDEAKAVQFPIVSPSVQDPPKEFSRQSNQHLGCVASAHIAIIERVQPYHGLAGRPNSWSGEYIHQLTLLQDLSNMDKHRMLIPFLTPPSKSEFISGVHGIGKVVSQCIDHYVSSLMRGGFQGGNRLEEGTILFSAPVTSPLERDVNVAGYVTPTIQLPEGGVLIPTIDRIATFVAYIIGEFEPLF